MTDATVLADALVEAGIGRRHNHKDGGGQLKVRHTYSWNLSAEDFITDWRVAGKVLESVSDQTIYEESAQATDFGFLRSPRAIIEAWYEARQ